MALGLVKYFKFKGDKIISEDPVKFHKKWTSSEDIKDDINTLL